MEIQYQTKVATRVFYVRYSFQIGVFLISSVSRESEPSPNPFVTSLLEILINFFFKYLLEHRLDVAFRIISNKFLIILQ